MKVKTLIERLKYLDSDMQVFLHIDPPGDYSVETYNEPNLLVHTPDWHMTGFDSTAAFYHPVLLIRPGDERTYNIHVKKKRT